MSRKHHYLKCEVGFFAQTLMGNKSFEVRKNDRNYTIGGMVYLQESIEGVKTGRELDPKEIIYILEGGMFGIDKDYCVIQLGI